tara:strand:+ start:393 stop:1229 length:837 start_codon:yes stop_codon:yes gene_type:complete
MSGKLLIVGDSFCTYYVEENRMYRDAAKSKPYIFKIKPYKYWFQYFADDLNLEVLNLSRSGAGNQQIFENVIYALNTNKDIKTLILGWSSFDRFDLPMTNRGHLTLKITDDLIGSKTSGSESKHYSNKYVPLFREDELFPMERQIDRFLNYSVTLDSLCKSKDVELIQFFTVFPMERTLYLEKIGKENYYLKKYINNKLMNHINTDNFFGFPGEPKIGGTNMQDVMLKQKNYEDLLVNKERYIYSNECNRVYNIDSHPNGEGNKLIYETLKNFRLDKY